MNPRARLLLREGAIVAILAAVTLVETFPAWLAIRHPEAGFRIRDHFQDVAVIHWDLWWMRQAVVDLGVDPFHTPLLFHPEGVNLFLSPFVPLFGLASIPLQAVVPGPPGVVWAANVLTVLTFFLCAWMMSLFLRRLGIGVVPAVLAALPFAFAPFRFMHFARLHYLSSFWLPLYALCLVRFLDHGRRRSLVGAVVVGLATLLSDHHHLIFLLLIATAWVVYRLIRPVVARAVLLRRSAACGLLQAALLAPVLIGCAEGLGGGEDADLRSRLHFEQTAAGRPSDIHLLLAPDASNLAYILLPHLHRAVIGRPAGSREPATPRAEGEAAAAGGLPYRELHEHACLVGQTPRAWKLPPLALSILLAAVFLFAVGWARRPGTWVWAALCLGALLVALGPTRVLFGTTIPMPYQALAFLVPPLKASRYPAVFVLLALFAAAPVLGFGLHAAFARGRTGRAARVGVIALYLAAGVSGIHRPLRFEAPAPVEAYQVLVRDPAPGAVLELPLGDIYLWRTAMAGQRLHGRPLGEGGVTRAGPRARRFLDHDPLVRILRDPPPAGDPPAADAAAARRRNFVAAGFRYILVHHDHYPDAGVLARTLAAVRAHRPAREQRLGPITLFVLEAKDDPRGRAAEPEPATR